MTLEVPGGEWIRWSAERVTFQWSDKFAWVMLIVGENELHEVVVMWLLDNLPISVNLAIVLEKSILADRLAEKNDA